jgi:hypothetical protein
MGYTTDFEGSFTFNKELTADQAEYINKFSTTRHMIRKPDKIKLLYPDWESRTWNGDLGVDGEFFLDCGYDYCKNDSVVDNNVPPATQPGLWCQWVISEDRSSLEWDGGEKFYNYVEWLEYLIENIFKPIGLELNGSIDWQGEDEDDMGTINVRENEILIC